MTVTKLAEGAVVQRLKELRPVAAWATMALLLITTAEWIISPRAQQYSLIEWIHKVIVDISVTIAAPAFVILATLWAIYAPCHLLAQAWRRWSKPTSHKPL